MRFLTPKQHDLILHAFYENNPRDWPLSEILEEFTMRKDDIKVERHITALKRIMNELNCEADVALAILRFILCRD